MRSSNINEFAPASISDQTQQVDEAYCTFDNSNFGYLNCEGENEKKPPEMELNDVSESTALFESLFDSFVGEFTESIHKSFTTFASRRQGFCDIRGEISMLENNISVKKAELKKRKRGAQEIFESFRFDI